MRTSRILGLTLLSFCLLGLGIQAFSETTFFTSYIPRLIFSNNFAPVVNGKVYRSGEMSHQELTQVIKTYGIKTVLDLRAGDDEPDAQGYTEPKTVAELGAQYEHVPMFASRLAPRERIEQLLQVFDTAKQPILLHCSSGTHRSGVASAIWLLDKEAMAPEEAIKQLSAAFGYFTPERKLKTWLQGHPTLDAMMFRYLNEYQQHHQAFRDWIKQALPPKTPSDESASSAKPSV